eukprot:485396_1
MMKKGFVIGVAFLLIAFVMKNLFTNMDFLTSMNENRILSSIEIQLGAFAFCLTGSHLMNSSNGRVDEIHYDKQSIYSVLYSLYDYLGQIESDNNISYQFTFNTWGFGPSLFDSNDPERFGKTAYKSLLLFEEIEQMIEQKVSKNETIKILEVGCGTGAGANLIVNEISKQYTRNIKYIALDMQLAAIKTCKDIHESDLLQCVQGNGMNLTFNNNIFDIVIISETHIAEDIVDSETEIIINEIIRVLRDGGFFVWGNALCTDTWNDIINYLPTKQFESCGANNVTSGAIDARDGDKERVEMMWDSIHERLILFQWYSKCDYMVKTLMFNFYRHPGTDLYDSMVNGRHSYMQICSRMKK